MPGLDVILRFLDFVAVLTLVVAVPVDLLLLLLLLLLVGLGETMATFFFFVSVIFLLDTFLNVLLVVDFALDFVLVGVAFLGVIFLVVFFALKVFGVSFEGVVVEVAFREDRLPLLAPAPLLLLLFKS